MVLGAKYGLNVFSKYALQKLLLHQLESNFEGMDETDNQELSNEELLQVESQFAMKMTVIL